MTPLIPVALLVLDATQPLPVFRVVRLPPFYTPPLRPVIDAECFEVRSHEVTAGIEVVRDR